MGTTTDTKKFTENGKIKIGNNKKTSYQMTRNHLTYGFFAMNNTDKPKYSIKRSIEILTKEKQTGLLDPRAVDI